MENKNEIILYQPGDTVRLEVMLGDETVWLTQAQMVELFQTTKQNVSLHISKIFREGELSMNSTVKYYLTPTGGGRFSKVKLYNLDVIISVGYRVKSKSGTQFRIWATKVLREHLLKGNSALERFERIESRVSRVEEKVDFFVKTALPPIEGIFYEGQVFEAYKFVCKLIKSAKKRLILIDNYVDESVLSLLAKRKKGVTADIYTKSVSKALRADLRKHNAQYAPISIKKATNVHDRFLIVDDDVYHIGASIKDLGKKLFAFSKLNLPAKDILGRCVK